jgi:hypothetical protein
LGDSGRFEAGPFWSGELPYEAGAHRIRVVSYFTEAWKQPPGVGAAYARLPARLLVPDDPLAPKAGRHLQVTVGVDFPPILPEFEAISAVKNAMLTVGSEESGCPVRTVVRYFAAHGVRPVAWSGARSGRTWTVSYACLDGSEPDTARWEYDPGSGRVSCRNPLADKLSWLPSEYHYE